MMSQTGPDILYSATYREPEQQWFTIQSDVMTSIISRQSSAFSGHQLTVRTDFGPAIGVWDL